MTAPTENRVKAPAWAGLPAQASGAGSGASPAHTATAQYTYEMPYRRCIKRGGLTYPIALCLECKKLVKPVRSELSRTGAHGTWYYVHEHLLLFVILKQSNSGKRSLDAEPGLPESLVDAIRRAWTFFHYEPEEIENILAALLEEKRAG